MSQQILSKVQQNKDLHQSLQKINASDKNEIRQVIFDLLKQASSTEHLLAMQYLFTCFSMKKYPEEFSDYQAGATAPEQIKINQIRLAQIEKIRRWEANILMVSREEMTHLCYVMNLMALIDEDPYLFRPNFPVPASSFPLDKPVNLMPFSPIALEIFRYWEKPDHLPVRDPLEASGLPENLMALFTIPHKAPILFNADESSDKAIDILKQILDKTISENVLNQIKDPLVNGSIFNSIEELYQTVKVFMHIGLQFEIFFFKNPERIVDEHYGFNIDLNPLILGQVEKYIDEAIQQILEEGEGVTGVPPALGSHFWAFQTIIDEYQAELKDQVLPFVPALPVVWNPSYPTQNTRHIINSMSDIPVTPYKVDNVVAIQAMQLFDLAYTTMVRMLSGFFGHYEIDQTTGIRPPRVNAYFQTTFYPFMTNVIRPLGEMICRLPANESFVPDGGKVPDACAGPDFLFEIDQKNSCSRKDATAPFDKLEDYLEAFAKMQAMATALSAACTEKGYHMAYYLQPDARDFDVSFAYLAENFERIGKNFSAYWNGEIVAPISSKGFQNYSSTIN